MKDIVCPECDGILEQTCSDVLRCIMCYNIFSIVEFNMKEKEEFEPKTFPDPFLEKEVI